MVCLNDIQGLWRRSLIAFPERKADTTTEVYWLQGPRLYADLRIPDGRPPCRASCLRELDWPLLEFLAWQEGFFGHVDIDDSIAHWHRAFDYQPPTGREDRGHLAFEGEILIERGVETSYVEHWVREPQSGEVTALSLKTEARTGCLIVAGQAFMFAKSRSMRLPAGAHLSECLGAAGSLADAQDLFDCEVSFGRVRNDEWRIERSSLPFREGHRLRPDIESEPGKLVLDDIGADKSAMRRAWHIVAAEGTSALTLRQWLAPKPAADTTDLVLTESAPLFPNYGVI